MVPKSPKRAVEAPAAMASGVKIATKTLPMIPDKRQRAKKALEPNRSSAKCPK